MTKIIVEHDPDLARLNALGVARWPARPKEISVFPWTCDAPHGGDAVRFGEGDLVTFCEGPACTWGVRGPLRQHDRIG